MVLVCQGSYDSNIMTERDNFVKNENSSDKQVIFSWW